MNSQHWCKKHGSF